jgi:hypothetical protein
VKVPAAANASTPKSRTVPMVDRFFISTLPQPPFSAS